MELARPTRQGVNLPEYSVSELSAAARRTLEGAYGYVRLRGEISGFRGAHSSGHCYFGLKDDKSKIEAVIWRTTVQGLRIKPAEGLEVIATGRVTTYPGSSRYQIIIDALEPAGIGALMALLEERKKHLAAEGLFDESRKRRLPFIPRVIGLVTSPTGAVVRDMLHGFNERFPVCVVLWPVRVQGETCAAEVSAAIKGFNALRADGPVPRPDLLIVARGGGSLEDLWGFNEESVARAAAESHIPLISAVGHETDWTLIDFVADARAPTPTKAAEWAVPKFADLSEQTGKLALRLKLGAQRALNGMRAHLRGATRGLPRLRDVLALPRQRFDAMDRRLGRALLANTKAHGLQLVRFETRLHPRLLELRLSRAHHGLDALARRAATSLTRVTGPRRARYERIAGRLSLQPTRERIERCSDRIGALHGSLQRSVLARLQARRRHLDGCAKLLASLGYKGVLQRGYALVRDVDGRTVRSAAQVAAGQRLDVELADGHVGVQAREDAGSRATRANNATQAPARRNSGSGNQGSLF